MYEPGIPEFPVPAEITAHIPPDLPGEVPKTLSEFMTTNSARMPQLRASLADDPPE